MTTWLTALPLAGCGTNEAASNEAVDAAEDTHLQQPDDGAVSYDAPTFIGTSSIDGAQAPVGGLCEWPETLPNCFDDFPEYTVCDGSVPGCITTTDAAEPEIYVCQNLTDNVPLRWTKAVSLHTPCANRHATGCPDMIGESDQALVGSQLTAVLSHCVGSEGWLAASFVDGCAQYFTISSSRPDQIACAEEELGKERYACATDVRCGAAILSTLR